MDDAPVQARIATVEEYMHWRAVMAGLHTRIIRTAQRAELVTCSESLGLSRGGKLTLSGEVDAAVLSDAILHERRGGRTLVERFAATTPPDELSADELVALNAMRNARYSIWIVLSARPGHGVQVEDALTGEELFLHDVNFSKCSPEGSLLASRVTAPLGITMSAGAGLTLGELPEGERRKPEGGPRTSPLIDGLRKAHASDPSRFSLNMIRAGLQRGVADHMRLAEPGESPVDHEPFSALYGAGGRGARFVPSMVVPDVERRRTPRNEPCPCGSGKKFKKCCGAGN